MTAYAAGEETPGIAARFGVTTDEVLRIVATGTMPPTAPAAGRPLPAKASSGMAVAGWVLLVLGLLGPCLIGVAWLAVYYLSAAAWPVEAWGVGNVAAGLIIILLGLFVVSAAITLIMLSRRKRRQAGSR
ncbi:cell division protein CrgA [Actinoplanes sp. NPDC023801]|uniref:cell division protein CrgA n=1 Tax=Actinoplanes sp. NPDC023801 TaxID=3154595 RepID=UPI0033CB5AF3